MSSFRCWDRRGALAGWAWGEMQQPGWSVHLDAVPQPPGDDEGTAGAEGVALLPTWRLDDDRHLPRLQVDQLVAVGVTFTAMRRWLL